MSKVVDAWLIVSPKGELRLRKRGKISDGEHATILVVILPEPRSPLPKLVAVEGWRSGPRELHTV